MLDAEYSTPPRANGRPVRRAARPRPRPRPRLRPRSLLAAAVSVPAIAAVAVVLVAGTLGGRDTSAANAAIIRHADAALVPPPNAILHTRVQSGALISEFWQLTSPPYSFVGDKGPAGQAPEVAQNGASASYYVPATNTIHDVASTKQAPQSFDNPLADVRQSLQNGQARVLGTAVIDRVNTYEIQFADKRGFSSQSVIAYVDQSTYRPIMLSEPQPGGQTVQVRLITFEYLPATPANMRLLSLTDRHPTASVVTDSPGTGGPGTGGPGSGGPGSGGPGSGSSALAAPK
jgi:hypothetical protein